MLNQGIYTENLPPLPEQVKLPVLRSTYCSMDCVNVVSAYLWAHQPALIQELAACEMIEDILLSHTGHHTKICDQILQSLEKEDAAPTLPETPLGRLDMLFEISRRIRHALSCPEIGTIGHALAESRDGPFPDMVSRPVVQNRLEAEHVPQETVDSIIAELYAEKPQFFYDYAEQTRLFVFSFEIKQNLERAVWERRPEDQSANGAFLGLMLQEINARLDMLCDFSKDMAFRGYLDT